MKITLSRIRMVVSAELSYLERLICAKVSVSDSERQEVRQTTGRKINLPGRDSEVGSAGNVRFILCQQGKVNGFLPFRICGAGRSRGVFVCFIRIPGSECCRSVCFLIQMWNGINALGNF